MQWDLYDVLMILAAYLIGNISPAIILGKISGVDIKKEGSGNAGTTNVLRVLGKKAALITLIVDISKGFLAVRLGMLLGYETGAICAVAVFCGHIWPCFYRFKEMCIRDRCKPANLLEFAVMGSIYMEKVIGRRCPRIGLVNVGEESKKGSALTKVTYEMLTESDLNFVGNVEAREVPKLSLIHI